jgi:hypothetical protein
MMQLLEEMGGLPDGQRLRPVSERVRALDWQLERFGEMCILDPSFAARVMNCHRLPFHRALMLFRYRWRIYRAPGGDLVHAVDQFIAQAQAENVKR